MKLQYAYSLFIVLYFRVDIEAAMAYAFGCVTGKTFCILTVIYKKQ